MIGFGLIKGLSVTFRNLFSPVFTVQYPDKRVGVFGLAKSRNLSILQLFKEDSKQFLYAVLGLATVKVKNEQFPRFRGNEFVWYDDRCTACASCAKYCPLGIIEIVTHASGENLQAGENYAIDKFDIDTGRCMFCGLCVEACPYDALHMGTDFERGNYHRSNLVLDKETLISQVKNPSSWFRPQFEEKEYNPWDSEISDYKEAGRHEKPSNEKIKQNWVNKRKFNG
ncbi:MAG: hypothetical protein CL745_04190 [Chloroflexi bacterium]|nr:hypothetical protein [Chloroflexota bacterium]|tara:strand:- start:14184 stop:14861 length:678 start_codon:yes stop_codon:yes gene_type:complete